MNPPTPPSDGLLATPDPEQPVPVVAGRKADPWWLVGPGFAILVGCLFAGEAAKRALHLILPGNILGLFILLALLGCKIVPLRWVEGMARLLLFLLPLLFVPIFVLALKKAVHLPQGGGYFGAVAVGVLLLWAGVGRLAQFLLAPASSPTTDNTPKSDPA